MTDGRFGHEDTATDRWVGSLLDVRRRDHPARVDALVDRSVDAVRAGAGDRAGARRRAAGGWRWRTPLAAAASIAVIAGAALLLAPQPASASALLRAAQAAESGAGDRRYRIELSFPRRGPDGPAPRATGTLDVRDPTHVRLELLMPEGRAMVRAMDGNRAWTVSPEGDVLSVPTDAPWPRFVETPEGELLVDRLDSLLADVGAFYSIERCDAGTEMRLCAQRVDPSFRGPERITLTLDAATKSVRRAELVMGEPPRMPRPDGPHPEGPRGEGPRRPAPPVSIVVTRTEVPGGSFADGWFAPPSAPTGSAPPEGRRMPHPGDGPRPPRGDREDGPPHPRHEPGDDLPPPPFGPPPRD